MDLQLAYLGRSELREAGAERLLSFTPNLSRDPVAFDAALRQPLRFREAISALHDVVINDLRYKPRDKTAYEAWKKNEQQRLNTIRNETAKQARAEILARQAVAVPADIEQQYNRCRTRYWKARQAYSNFLLEHDRELWRMLMPCDPIVTVAEDVVYFECFSADEASYGCLTVDRAAGFGNSPQLQFGTTNVDYSWNLYHHFQSLRTYRETRLQVDPAGFSVKTAGNPDYREEKIPLPPGWLRGLMQVQTAMTLPMQRVTLSREAVYNLVAWYRRHRARKSPRALRFELVQGRAPRLVMEPWEQVIESPGSIYNGPSSEAIRLWGAKRLTVLGRLLPLLDRVEVHLLGTGLPSFWVAHLGEMRLTLGLSGWTANDWTHGSAMDTLAPPLEPKAELQQALAAELRRRGSATDAELATALSLDRSESFAGLNRLAHTGQVIYDLGAGRYRWRQIMPQALGEAELGGSNAELVAAKQLLRAKRVTVTQLLEATADSRLITGKVENQENELVLNSTGMIKRGKCRCSHHYRFGIRNGPCRHLLALRMAADGDQGTEALDLKKWFERINVFKKI